MHCIQLINQYNIRLHSEPQCGHMCSFEVRPQRGHIYGLYESFVIPNSFPNGLSGSINIIL